MHGFSPNAQARREEPGRGRHPGEGRVELRRRGAGQGGEPEIFHSFSDRFVELFAELLHARVHAGAGRRVLARRGLDRRRQDVRGIARQGAGWPSETEQGQQQSAARCPRVSCCAQSGVPSGAPL